MDAICKDFVHSKTEMENSKEVYKDIPVTLILSAKTSEVGQRSLAYLQFSMFEAGTSEKMSSFISQNNHKNMLEKAVKAGLTTQLVAPTDKFIDQMEWIFNTS